MPLGFWRSVDVHGGQLVALLLYIKQGELVELRNLFLPGGSERLHVVISVFRTKIFCARGVLGGNGLLAGTLALIRVQYLVEALSNLLQSVTKTA
jgi:hypothetical protein